MAGPRQALILRSKGQRSRSQGYDVCCRRGMHVDTAAYVSSLSAGMRGVYLCFA